MRINDNHPSQAAYEAPARGRFSRDPAQSRSTTQPPEDVSSLSLPAMLALTAPQHPQREGFLSTLSESLRAGVLSSTPETVAQSLFRLGFDRAE